MGDRKSRRYPATQHEGSDIILFINQAPPPPFVSFSLPIQFLLNHGELRGEFDGWEVLLDDVRPISDGRPLSFFVARKPPA